MLTLNQPHVSRAANLLVWLSCCILAGSTFIIYLGLGQSSGQGVVMPLDDAYIHFQYARQLASGQPYIYNPGLPPTSGATSFLYPYVLAIGSLLGFSGQNLGIWALAVGFAALALCGWLIYRFSLGCGVPLSIAALGGFAFQLHGAAAWHAASGMETMLATLFLLWLLNALLQSQHRAAIVAASLCALTRPEGLIAAGAAMLVLAGQNIASVEGETFFTRLKNSLRLTSGRWLALLIPFAAALVQPAVNYLLTGSAVASGNAAKSLFGIIPLDLSVIAARIAENFVRMWREWVTSSGALWYVGPFVATLAVLGGIALWLMRQRRIVVFVLLTLVFTALAISTLDTAFWHFKRYQMPLIALFSAFAPLGAAFLANGFSISPRWRARKVLLVAAGASVAVTLVISWRFAPAYAANTGYVAAQPLLMARWLFENAPDEAAVAVHDVGAMRYLGERTTLDIVGLTTPGAADYWRNGPGSVGEFIDAQRPDLIASYGEGHGLGLGYLAATDLYAETLAEYRVTLDPAINVALAAELQGIYLPDYTAADNANQLSGLPNVAAYLDGLTRVDILDVADIQSERAHNYLWRNDELPGGFPTEYYQFDTLGCAANCSVMDGGRRINGEERFSIHATPGEDVVLVTRLHPANAGRYQVFASGELVAERVVPMLPGAFLEVPVLIPGSLVMGDATEIRIVPVSEGNFYMPYTHFVYQGHYAPPAPQNTPLSSFQNGSIQLLAAELAPQDGVLQVRLNWNQPADLPQPTGDYVIFVHVLGEDGSIAAQADRRPGNGTLPPGNWLPGQLADQLDISISHLPPGTYDVVLGLFDPVTFERLVPVNGDESNRLHIGSFALD